MEIFNYIVLYDILFFEYYVNRACAIYETPRSALGFSESSLTRHSGSAAKGLGSNPGGKRPLEGRWTRQSPESGGRTLLPPPLPELGLMMHGARGV